MPRVCHLVLALSLFVPACYDMHGRDGRVDAGAPIGSDAGSTRPDTSLPSPDAGARPDVPSVCPLLRADASCLETAIFAGQPFELPFQYDTCGCCIETSCSVLVDERTRTLRLTTGLCPDPCDCDACITPRGTCSVPAISEDAAGQWTVEVNGTAAFTTYVAPREIPSEPVPPTCATYAEIDECGGARPDFTTGPVRGDICVEAVHHADRTTLRVVDPCWDCGRLDSSCTVTVHERLTDDLPPGYDIDLHARDYWTACDVDCPAVCIPHTRECDVPALDPSAYNRVFVDGEYVTAYVAGGPSAPCGDAEP